VLVSGPDAGQEVVADGTANVPARLNGGRINGVLVPQSEGNEFTFRGRLRIAGDIGGHVAAGSTDAAALPEEALGSILGTLEDALKKEHFKYDPKTGLVVTLPSEGEIDQAINDLISVTGDLSSVPLAQIDRNYILQKLSDAKKLDDEAKADIAKHKPHAAALALAFATKDKRKAFRAIYRDGQSLGLIPAEPQVEQPKLPVNEMFVPAATNADGTVLAGAENPGTVDSKAVLIESGLDFTGPSGSAFYTFGPAGGAAGEFGGKPIFLSNPFSSGEQPIFLPEPTDGVGGNVLAGGPHALVGFVQLSVLPFEKAAVWFPFGGGAPDAPAAHASSLHFKGFTVRGFTGGSGLFTVFGKFAFGDHFDRGVNGRFRAFRLTLKTGVVTELFRPAGASSQPTASDATGLVGGASQFSNGHTETTYWWGDQHYVRFASPGVDSYVTGMNDAGVSVGAVGPPGRHHAALFERGKAYDLNALIPPGSGWILTRAAAISDRGVIVGTGVLNGVQRGFVLKLSG
jgi:hypothetical protein